MDASSSIPQMNFNLLVDKSGEKFEHWADHLSPIFSVDIRYRPDSFNAYMSSYFLDGIIVAETNFTAQSFKRDHVKIAQSDMDHYLIHLYRTGGFSGVCGTTQIDISAGDLFVYNSNVPLHTQAGDSTTIALAIPKSMLDQYASISPNFSVTKIEGRSSIGRILSSHIISVFNTLSDLTLNESLHVAEGLAAITASTLAARLGGGGNEKRPLTQALQERAEHFINERIFDPCLSVELICKEMNVSRAHLYRAFANYGGLSQFITNRRLLRAIKELRSNARRGETISEISYRCGFSSESHFRRQVRANFGVSPSDIRGGLCLTREIETEPVLSRWFKGFCT